MNITISGLHLVRDGSDEQPATGQISWTGPPRSDWLELGPEQLESSIASFLQDQGFDKPESVDFAEKQEAIITVAAAGQSSSYDATSPAGLLIRRDETLAAWWTAFNARHEPDARAAVTRTSPSRLDVNETAIELHRTLRVPDDGNTYKLPLLEPLPLIPVDRCASTLPESILAKGGYITPMHNREALWVSFPSERSAAVKVSVGGISAITGLSASEKQHPKDAVQDYLAPSQAWLDGIAKEPGVVRQLVAIEPEGGYTVEEQLTGKNSEATLLIDVCPLIRPDFTIKSLSACDYHKTPKALGLAGGAEIRLEPTGHLAGKTLYYMLKLYGKALKLQASYGNKMKIFVMRRLDQVIPIFCESSQTIWSLKLVIEKYSGVPLDQQRLSFQGRQLQMDRTLADYDIQTKSTLHLVLPQRGGGPPIRGMGIAMGGQIKQNIHANGRDHSEYNFEGGQRVYIHVINAAQWKSITGWDAPPKEVEKATYSDFNLPWFEAYNEPEGLSRSLCGLPSVQSILELDSLPRKKRQRMSDNHQDGEDTFTARWQDGRSGLIVPIDWSFKSVSPAYNARVKGSAG